MSHVAFLFSCAAYAACVLILAGFHRRVAGRNFYAAIINTPETTNDQEVIRPARARYAAGLFALAAFFALPPGALPPLLAAPWGGFFFFACLFLSLACASGPRPSARSGLFNLCRMAVIAAILACYVFQRGVPGSALNWGTYAAMPLWEISGPAGKAALGLLCCGFFLELVRFPDRERQLQRLALTCLLIVFFAPWTWARAQPGSIPALAADFFLFWAKALCASWLADRARARASRVPASWMFIFTGALLLTVDLW